MTLVERLRDAIRRHRYRVVDGSPADLELWAHLADDEEADSAT